MEEDEEVSDDSGIEEEGDTNVLDEENMEYTMDASTVEPVLITEGAPAGIDEAEPGRLYTMWPGEICPSCLKRSTMPDLTNLC
jgi:hypothetical protein